MARGEVESMIKFQHEIGANSTVEEDQSLIPQHREGIEQPQQWLWSQTAKNNEYV